MDKQAHIALVRRFYDDMCNERRLDLAPELFAEDCALHDPQIPGIRGPQAIADTVRVYQVGVEGRWTIDDIFADGDGRVTVRWTGTGLHSAECMGIAPTGKSVRVDAISVFRIASGRIAEAWEVWDTLGFLQQLGVVPAK